MPALALAEVSTPLGPMLLAATERGLAAIGHGSHQAGLLAKLARRFPTAEPRHDPPALAAAARWLEAFLTAERRDLAPVDLAGLPPFDAAVYAAVRAVPYGATATYGDIAAAIGVPRAARAVGGALARCPLFPAVPCHRVVRGSDGWSGWGSVDLAPKRRLQAVEQAGQRIRPATSAHGSRAVCR